MLKLLKAETRYYQQMMKRMCVLCVYVYQCVLYVFVVYLYVNVCNVCGIYVCVYTSLCVYVCGYCDVYTYVSVYGCGVNVCVSVHKHIHKHTILGLSIIIKMLSSPYFFSYMYVCVSVCSPCM